MRAVFTAVVLLYLIVDFSDPLLRLAPVRLSPRRVGRQVRPGPGMAVPLHAVRHLPPDPSPEAG